MRGGLATEPLQPLDPTRVERFGVTLSGARISPVAPARAQMFLAAIGEHTPTHVQLALGAFQDDWFLIGIGTLGVTGSDAPVYVAVHPARRRLGVGTDLAHALLREANSRRLRIINHGVHPHGAGRAFRAALEVSLGLAGVPETGPRDAPSRPARA